MKPLWIPGAVLGLLAASAGQAGADLITYTGNFSATFSGSGFPPEFAGSFTFQFDISTIPSSGFFDITPTLTSLTPSNPGDLTIGNTTFTTTNTGIELTFQGGQLLSGAIGSTQGGLGNATPGINGFVVQYEGPTLDGSPAGVAEAASTTTSGRTTSSSTTGIIEAEFVSAVPEPSTAIVAAFGAVAILAYGWSRHSREQRRQAAA
jgi:hypothetical protein